MLLDLQLRNRRRQQDASAASGAGQFGDRNIGRARQCGCLVQRGATPVGEHEAAIAAIARDAVGKCQRKHHAGGRLPSILPPLFPLPPPLPSPPTPPPLPAPTPPAAP